MTAPVQDETTITEMAESFLDVVSAACAGIPASVLVNARLSDYGVSLHFNRRADFDEVSTRFGLETQRTLEHQGQWQVYRTGVYAGVSVEAIVILPAGETP